MSAEAVVAVLGILGLAFILWPRPSRGDTPGQEATRAQTEIDAIRRRTFRELRHAAQRAERGELVAIRRRLSRGEDS